MLEEKKTIEVVIKYKTVMFAEGSGKVDECVTKEIKKKRMI